MSSIATDARNPSLELPALQLFIALLLALRLWFQLQGGILGDEAYYWMWGQHPGWSYFDHPPLHAWLLGVVALFGWHPFAVRALTWVSLAVVLMVLRAWAHRLGGADPRLWFWRATAVYLASPVLFVLTSTAYNDHLLVALSLASVHCFILFTERVESGAAGGTRWLFAAALLLGLAVLTKYNGVFVGLGFALAFLLRPRLRALLASPAPWLAALLAIAIQLPVLWWNIVEAGASFRYHLDDRWGGSHSADVFRALRFVGLSLLFWSPFLVWPLVRLIRTKAGNGFFSATRFLALAIFVASTAILVVVAIVLDAYFYWNIVALVSLTPLVAGFANRWLRALHYLYGLFWAALLFVNFTIAPIVSFAGMKDYGTALNYDWHLVAERMQEEQATHPGALVGATRYSTTAQLGFALRTVDVVKLSPEHSQWDYWQAGRDLGGASALILVDEPDESATLHFLRAHFTALETIDSFPVERLGQAIYSWRIMYGTGWHD